VAVQALSYGQVMLLLFISQLLELVFPKAEALKKRLKEKFAAEEKKRSAELVSSCHYS